MSHCCICDQMFNDEVQSVFCPHIVIEVNMNKEASYYDALKNIAAYATPRQIRREADREYGLDYAEALEMAYENMRESAKRAIMGHRRPRVPNDE